MESGEARNDAKGTSTEVERSVVRVHENKGPSRLRTRDLSEHDFEKPKVLVIVTGGTICMIEEGIGASLRNASLNHQLKELADGHSDALPSFDVAEWEDLIDSSDVSLCHWLRIAKHIEKVGQIDRYYSHQNYCFYDGFVVLHGTDTMAYTASALSFMLENLNKPVVFTGAMLPIHHIQTDARRNFAVALMIGAYSHITEVVVLFGSRLLRGNRCSKLDCSQMDAFNSPNFPCLGKVGVDINVDEQLLLMPSKRGFRIFAQFCMNIVVVTMTPGFQPSLLRHLFSSPTRPLGVILKVYGSGTAPTRHPELISTLRCGIESGVEIMAVSQCIAGTCSLLTYENGALLYHIGVIEGKDLTTEAAFAKLAYVMGKGYSGEKLRYLMETDIRGEITERPGKVTGQASLSSMVRRVINEIPTKSLPRIMNNHSEMKYLSATGPQALETPVSEDKVFSDTEALRGSTRSSVSSPGSTAIKQVYASQQEYMVSDKDEYRMTDPSTISTQVDEQLKDLVAGIRAHAQEFRDLITDIKAHSNSLHTERNSTIHTKKEEMLQHGTRHPVVPAEIFPK